MNTTRILLISLIVLTVGFVGFSLNSLMKRREKEKNQLFGRSAVEFRRDLYNWFIPKLKKRYFEYIKENPEAEEWRQAIYQNNGNLRDETIKKHVDYIINRSKSNHDLSLWDGKYSGWRFGLVKNFLRSLGQNMGHTEFMELVENSPLLKKELENINLGKIN